MVGYLNNRKTPVGKVGEQMDPTTKAPLMGKKPIDDMATIIKKANAEEFNKNYPVEDGGTVQPAPKPKAAKPRTKKEIENAKLLEKVKRERYKRRGKYAAGSGGTDFESDARHTKKMKTFASGPAGRKSTSGKSDARKGVVTRALSKALGDKRSKKQMTATRKANQAFWDNNGPDK